jgi:hypothetical protein
MGHLAVGRFGEEAASGSKPTKTPTTIADGTPPHFFAV